jgi:hypothetical protein
LFAVADTAFPAAFAASCCCFCCCRCRCAIRGHRLWQAVRHLPRPS